MKLSLHSQLHGVTITFPHSLVAFTPFLIPWFQSIELCSVPRHDLFSLFLHGWPTHSIAPTWNDLFFPAPHFNPSLSLDPQLTVLPPWGLTWCPQLEVTSPSAKFVCSSALLWWQPKPSFYISHLTISSSPLLPEGMDHVLGIFVSPTVSIWVPGKWYLKDICWIEEWGC